MLVLRSRIPRVSSAAWALRVAALVDAARSRFCLLSTGATRRGRYASRAARGRSGCSPARCRPDGASLGCLSRTLSETRCGTPRTHSKRAAPPMNRSVGLRPLVLEHRNDKCDPRATTLAEERSPAEVRRSPQHRFLALGTRRARPQERVRRQRLDWRGRHLDALLDSFGRRPPQAPQPLRQH